MGLANCAPGRAVTDSEECRAAAADLRLPLTGPGFTKTFTFNEPYHQCNCFILTLNNVRSVHFNFDKTRAAVSLTSSVAYGSAVCLKGESSFNPPHSSW